MNNSRESLYKGQIGSVPKPHTFFFFFSLCLISWIYYFLLLLKQYILAKSTSIAALQFIQNGVSFLFKKLKIMLTKATH